jgi:hypothetical protein
VDSERDKSDPVEADASFLSDLPKPDSPFSSVAGHAGTASAGDGPCTVPPPGPGRGARDAFINRCLRGLASERVSAIDAKRDDDITTNILWSMNPGYCLSIPETPITVDPGNWVSEETRHDPTVRAVAAAVGIPIVGKAAAGILVQGAIEATKGRNDYLAAREKAKKEGPHDRELCESRANNLGL